jgi:hypothetical protein
MKQAGSAGADAAGTPRGVSDARLAGIVERLGRARQRTAYGTFVTIATGGVLIALTLFCVLQLMHGLLGSLAPWLAFENVAVPQWLAMWRPAPVPQHLMVAIDVAVVAMIIAPIVALMRRPEIDRMARAADTKFHLNESVSTALELSNKPEAFAYTGVVGQALLKSVQDRATTVEPGNLVPVSLPRAALGVPVLIAVAALLSIAPPPPLLQEAWGALRASPEVGTLTADERNEAAVTLQAIAAILKQDGEDRADPQIQQIAHDLEQLGKQLAQTPGMGVTDLTEGLDRLMARATEAYARVGEQPEAPTNFGRMISTVAAQLGVNRTKTIAPGARAMQQQEGWNRPDNPFTGLMTTRDEYNGPGRDDPADMVPPAQVLGDPGDGRFGAEGDGIVDAIGDGRAPDDDVYGPDGPGGGGGPLGEMVGGADGEGPGDFAGKGTTGKLFGDYMARLGLAAEHEMMLKNAAGGGGRRTRFNLPPQMGGENPDLGGAPAVAGGWVAKQEHEVTRTPLPATARDIVSRYFQALMVERGK